MSLSYFFQHFSQNSAVASLQQQLQNQSSNNLKKRIQVYTDAIPIIEDLMWHSGIEDETLEQYQSLCRELEQLRLKQGENKQHHFFIVIPVADRPQHLNACLDSLFKLGKYYQYAGTGFNKVTVLIADDSATESARVEQKKIANYYTQKGLNTLYFDQQEQWHLAHENGLPPVAVDNDAQNFYHKGASTMRNIAYLKLKQLLASHEKALCYFIDSDQEFCVKTAKTHGEKKQYAINFFYHLDHIFYNSNIQILTGKVVGDPPVSPSVMASNFIADVTEFLKSMAKLKPQTACTFHTDNHQKIDDVAYHDMADLFGFKGKHHTYTYPCALDNAHKHIHCFNDFAKKLNHFFDGEHPTRKTCYRHENLSNSLQPARTVYTGNYLFKPAGLKWFIPFSRLKLRMAGPVLGRIIQAEIGDKFISANLPMLHKRTLHTTGQSEFRPGIDRQQQRVDLSGEFERQFFGDIMLFSMESLTANGYPKTTPKAQHIENLLLKIEQEMLQRYQTKHLLINEQIAQLKSIFNNPEQWWQKIPECTQGNEKFNLFISNMLHNFDDHASGYKYINDPGHRQQRRQEIVQAILDYSKDRSDWEQQL